MIVDTSALVAIVRGEPGWQEYSAQLNSGQPAAMSAATFLEAAIVVDRSSDPADSVRFDRLVSEARLAIHAVTEDHARTARRAYRDFGKGSGHPAQLNFGDCFSYALATATGEALLYKGTDFRRTGILSALPD